MTITAPSTTTTAQPSRQVRRAQTRKSAREAARQSPDAEPRRLTEEILDAAAAKAAAAAQAATLAKAQLAEAEVQAWLKDMDARLEVIFAHPEQNLGEIEEQLAASVKEPLRLMAQRAAQVKANAVPCQYPEHHCDLTQQKHLCRTIHSRFGEEEGVSPGEAEIVAVISHSPGLTPPHTRDLSPFQVTLKLLRSSRPQKKG